jgi:Tfp pilus assembly protein PilE
MKAHRHSKLFASNSGFTRVELSVVVVICIILGVMSSACSNSQNSQQRQTVCISNLKQWGLVWQYYTDDNEGYFSNGSKSTTGDDSEWAASLQKF